MEGGVVMSTNNEAEVHYAEGLRMLAEVTKMQGELFRSLLAKGYMPPQITDLLTFTFGITTSAEALTKMIQAQTEILVAKAELGKM
jgi:hypothetical protein